MRSLYGFLLIIFHFLLFIFSILPLIYLHFLYFSYLYHSIIKVLDNFSITKKNNPIYYLSSRWDYSSSSPFLLHIFVAYKATSVLLFTPSLLRRLVICFFTVFSVIYNFSAICVFVSPLPISRKMM